MIEALKSFLIGRFAFSFALPSTCTGCLLCIRRGFLPVQDGLLVIRNVFFSVRGHGFGWNLESCKDVISIQIGLGPWVYTVVQGAKDDGSNLTEETIEENGTRLTCL